MTLISYNGNSLQTATIITSEIDYHSSPTRDVSNYAIAHGMNNTTPYTAYPDKVIKVSGTLAADSIIAMDNLEDVMKSYIVGKEKNLDIEHAGGTRRYIATPSRPVEIPRPGGLAWSTFNITFLCKPFGRDVSLTNLASSTGNTLSTDTKSITVGGSAEYQYPIITFTLNSGTGLSQQTMAFLGSQTGQKVEIKRMWAPGDTGTIDVYSGSVVVNGTDTYFTGGLPQLNPGAASFSYIDTFTTRNVNWSLDYYKFWN